MGNLKTTKNKDMGSWRRQISKYTLDAGRITRDGVGAEYMIIMAICIRTDSSFKAVLSTHRKDIIIVALKVS